MVGKYETPSPVMARLYRSADEATSRTLLIFAWEISLRRVADCIFPAVSENTLLRACLVKVRVRGSCMLWRTQRTCLIALFSRILQQARRSYPEKTARRLPLVPIGGARRSRFSSFAANPVTYQTGSKTMKTKQPRNEYEEWQIELMRNLYHRIRYFMISCACVGSRSTPLFDT
jgi:hypothetical protein